MEINVSKHNIQAIAFDLGNVVFNFDYWILIDKIKDRIKISPQDLYNLIFFSDLCVDFEKGLEDEKTFFKRFSKLSGLDIDWEEFNFLWPRIFSLNKETINLINLLKNNFKIFLISNISRLHYDFLSSTYPEVFDLFSAQVLSFKVNSIKPEPKIYDILEISSGISRKNMIYTDDRKDLIEAARGFGYEGFVFTDAKNFRAYLFKKGIL